MTDSDSYIINFDDNVSDEQIEEAKKHVEAKGGKVVSVLKVTSKGLVVEFPKGTVQALDKDSIPHATEVEFSQVVHTQAD